MFSTHLLFGDLILTYPVKIKYAPFICCTYHTLCDAFPLSSSFPNLLHALNDSKRPLLPILIPHGIISSTLLFFSFSFLHILLFSILPLLIRALEACHKPWTLPGSCYTHTYTIHRNTHSEASQSQPASQFKPFSPSCLISYLCCVVLLCFSSTFYFSPLPFFGFYIFV
ncbi:uncharacterized protein ARB_01901 [Trichophyton benhamiae CBS 112371]|uniref:Uncharacterized protein n=1 Tax=Arthroderma benhamiae (strain ATCC MYA-4681 / CBS 112371) TaxID=663331 RepID=D4B0C7_ARTBC|nr:uncharacterized protein ARB_01901 [Trichophyton benhamiae CBS 112371]EFE31279.1 hypothetical protein ARB_01901 [Trichophyton benhamiae CBS 112371]